MHRQTLIDKHVQAAQDNAIKLIIFDQFRDNIFYGLRIEKFGNHQISLPLYDRLSFRRPTYYKSKVLRIKENLRVKDQNHSMP